MFTLLTGIGLGWLFFKLQDRHTQKQVRKIEEDKTIASQNKHLEHWIQTRFKELAKEQEAYERVCSINKALHEKYLNDFESFKQATIDEHIAKENKVREVWEKREAERKAKKKEFAKKHLNNGGEQ